MRFIKITSIAKIMAVVIDTLTGRIRPHYLLANFGRINLFLCESGESDYTQRAFECLSERQKVQDKLGWPYYYLSAGEKRHSCSVGGRCDRSLAG
jgi:hypothetical protein